MIKKVLVLKNLQSNILEEAVLTLKDGINIETDILSESNNFKVGYALSEAESIVEDCMYKMEKQNEICKKKSNVFNLLRKIFYKK